MRRHFFGTFEGHDPAGIDIVYTLLDEVSELLNLTFFAAEQSQPGGDHVVRAFVSPVFHLLLDEGLVVVTEMDLGHFDLLLFSFSTKIFGFQGGG
jgi:hypothetical protein